MNASEYRSATRTLFEEWEQKLKDDIHIGEDGAVDPESYFSSSPRILFVLKEMNASPWARQSLTAFLRKDNDRGQTWNNVYRWRWGIRQVFADLQPEAIDFHSIGSIQREHRLDALKDIAVINLKKEPGYASSHMAAINGHAMHFSELLSRQVRLLDPDVIIAGGVWLRCIDGFSDVEDHEKRGAPALLHSFAGKQRLLIWTEHPQARTNAKGMFDELVRSCHLMKKQLHKH